MTAASWEVRRYAWSLSDGAGARLISTTTYRWRWLAQLVCWLSPSFRVWHSAIWCELHRERPKLTAIAGSKASVPKLSVGRTP